MSEPKVQCPQAGFIKAGAGLKRFGCYFWCRLCGGAEMIPEVAASAFRLGGFDAVRELRADHQLPFETYDD